MRILFLAPRFPFPVDRGDQYRVYHFLRVLAVRHRVTLLSFIERAEEERHRPEIEALGVRVRTIRLSRWRSLVSTGLNSMQPVRPFQVAYYDSPAMRAAVRTEAADADAVVASLARMAPYLDEVPEGVRTIVDLCDCISSEYRASLRYRSGLEKVLYREEERRMVAVERSIAEKVDEVWLVTRAEIEKIFGSRAPRNVVVVPNGVRIPEGKRTGARRMDAPRLLFTGNLRVPHNVDAAILLATRILPRVIAEIPGATLHIAGADPSPKVAALAGPSVTIHGHVPDLFELLRTGDVFVAPMRFVAGLQNKVIEALAAGVPVVTTPIVNRGLGGTSGVHVLLASDPIEAAEAIVRIVRDPVLAQSLAREGRRFVSERFRWELVLERFSGISAARSPESSAASGS